MRTLQFISFVVAGRLLAQEAALDSVAQAVPSVDTSAPHEAKLEGREVVAVPVGDPSSGGIRISRDELSRAPTLADALSREPGVLVRSAGGLGGFSTLSLRGSPSAQVEVRLDGVPLGGSAGSSVDLGPFALDGLERAEIVQAGWAGSDGSGRLDLVSRQGWARLGGSVRTGSFGEKGASGWWGDASGKAAVSGWWETSRNDYPFPWDNLTKVDNTGDDGIRRLSNNDYSGWGVAGVARPTEGMDASVRWEGSDKGVSSPSLPNPQGRWKRQSVQADIRREDDGIWRNDFEGSWRRGWSGWRDTARSTGYRADIASDETADDANASWSLHREAGGWMDPRLSVAGRWESSRRVSVGEVATAVTPNASRATASAGVGWSGKAGDLFGADLEGRWDLARDGRDFQIGLDGVSASSDTAFWRQARRGQIRIWSRLDQNLSGWVSGSARERLPDFSEWMGDNGAGLPNPGLKPERSAMLELGSRWAGRVGSASLSLWQAIYKDPIEAITAGSSPLIVHQNASGYQAVGLDAKMSFSIWRLGGVATTTLEKARTENPNPALNGNEPALTPRWKSSLEATANLDFGFTAGYTLDAQGQTWATDLNSPDDFRTVRILHGIWLRWKHRSLAVSAIVRNLTDFHPQDMQDLPLSGRQYQIRLDFDFARRSSTPTDISLSNNQTENTQ